jgi:hypothetical protein
MDESLRRLQLTSENIAVTSADLPVTEKAALTLR